MSRKDQRTALLGWSSGALVAVGAYIGALQLYPAEPSPPLLASLDSRVTGVDPIMTGSIGSGQPMPQLPSALQARLDSITMDMAALREALAAAQASGVSTNRRLADLEESLSFMTASIGQPTGVADDQALPDAIAPIASVTPEPRIVLPTQTPVDGGSIAVSMRPLAIGGQSSSEAQDMTAEAMDEPDMDGPDMASDEAAAPAVEPALTLSQTPFAIDIGGAASLEGIDALWVDYRERFGTTLADLTPRILLQQTSDGALDLRLVAGPIDDAADAAILCAQLVAAGLDRCLPAIFDGQQLALR